MNDSSGKEKMEYDPEFQRAAERTNEALGLPPNRPPPRFAKGDVDARRQAAPFYKKLLDLDTNSYDEIAKTSYVVKGHGGADIPVQAYRRKDEQKGGPAILYIHGGGMIFGTPELFEKSTLADVAGTGVPQFSVDYRVAPEFPHPTPVEDCYAALKWLYSQAQKLGIDKTRIAVMGLSAGGGLAAGVALMARDRGLSPPLAKQILLEPMLDDRNTTTDEDLMPLVTWSWDDNWTGWNALLGDEAGRSEVSEYAAPIRAKDASGLAPAYIDVGSADIFAAEDEAYATKLRNSGVKVDWHLYQGVPHGFELRGTGSKVLADAIALRRAAMQSF